MLGSARYGDLVRLGNIREEVALFVVANSVYLARVQIVAAQPSSKNIPTHLASPSLVAAPEVLKPTAPSVRTGGARESHDDFCWSIDRPCEAKLDWPVLLLSIRVDARAFR